MDLQKSIKTSSIQLLLFELFEDSGPGVPISLAQIPQNLRKNVHFEINYVELGFPKLKNLLTTLNSFIDIDLTKAAIVYTLRADTYQLVKEKREKLSK